MFWSHYLAISLTLLAAGVIVAVGVLAFNRSVSDLYGSVFASATTVSAPGTAVKDHVHEGVRWIRSVRGEMMNWAYALVAFSVILFVYTVLHQRRRR